MAYEIFDDRLYRDGEPVRFVPTSMHGRGKITPKIILKHHTAGSTAAGAISWLTKWRPTGKSSAHIVIDKSGEATQLLEFDRPAWHAGPSRRGKLAGLNSHAIGVELDNPGRLKKVGKDTCSSMFGKAYSIAKDGLVHIKNRTHGNHWWQPYTQAQLKADEEISRALIRHYGIDDVAGHWEVDTRGWKTDPSPLLDMDEDRRRFLGDVDDLWPLRVGKRGDEVETAQHRLKQLGYKQVGEADGIFGKMTRGAVLAWQADNEHASDGVLMETQYRALLAPGAREAPIGTVTTAKEEGKKAAVRGIGVVGGSGIAALVGEAAVESATNVSLWETIVLNLDAVVGQVAKIKALGLTITPKVAMMLLAGVVLSAIIYWAQKLWRD